MNALRGFRHLVMAAAFLAGGGLEAHEELYHNVEVRLVDTAESGEIEILFRVHAPEMVTASAQEAAEAMFDESWLRERSDEQLEAIYEKGRLMLGESFELGFEDLPAVDISGEVVFEDPERLRDPEVERDLPPACFAGALRLRVPPHSASRLRIANRESSEKRLLLVVVRAGTFPDVVDLDVGESVVVSLPDIPAPQGERRFVVIVALACVGIALSVTVLLVRRWVRHGIKPVLVGSPPGSKD